MPPSIPLAVTPPGAPWWPLVLPLAVGAAAIFLLLPRPQGRPVLLGSLLGLTALVLAGFFLIRAGHVTPEVILFYCFSTVSLVSGALLVTQQHPARAALSFALVVLSSCGLFLLLAAPFLMAATIVIYAGAIIVTFLFVLMLAQQTGLDNADARSREPLLSTLTGFLLLGALLYVLQASYGTGEVDTLIARARAAAAEPGGPDATQVFGDYKKYFQARGWEDLLARVKVLDEDRGFDRASAETRGALLDDLATLGEQARQRLGVLQPVGTSPLSNLSGPPPTVRLDQIRRDPDTGVPRMPHQNSAYLGRSLFTDYLLPVELGGTLLLIATVGAIAIAYRRATPAESARTGWGPGTTPERHA